MEIFKEFFAEYGVTLIYTVVTAIFGYLGITAKKLIGNYFADKEKRDVAETVVKFVEQVYKDLHGEEKLNKALSSASTMLAERGITYSETEMRMLIEASVAEFNKALGLKTA